MTLRWCIPTLIVRDAKWVIADDGDDSVTKVAGE